MHTVETRLLTLDSAWRAAQLGGHSVALWRLPKGSEKTLLIDFSDEDHRDKLDLDESRPGFALSPFLNPDGAQTRLLKADVLLKFSAENGLVAEQTSPSADQRRVLDWESQALDHQEAASPSEVKLKSDNSPKPPLDEPFLSLVERATKAIRAGQFQKVVLSRTKRVALPAGFNLVAAFNRLCVAYPNAFVSAVSLPNEGAVWLGASPETLVSVDAEGQFRTVSLAGTQPAFDSKGTLISPLEARWSHKEIEEQALVSRYIIECFKRIRLREYVENGPKTVQAGNLLHLRTDYRVDSKAVGFPQLGTIMLELLHPTSAVCGTPKAPALQFIQQFEGYDRDWYSGFLGPVNVDGESHLFVNLRTMKITDDEAILYAGAGITEDSIPEREWRETELKNQTLLNVIGGA